MKLCNYILNYNYYHLRNAIINILSVKNIAEASQPTTSDHINMKYIWGPHGKPYWDPTLITHRDLQKSVHIK